MRIPLKNVAKLYTFLPDCGPHIALTGSVRVHAFVYACMHLCVYVCNYTLSSQIADLTLL